MPSRRGCGQDPRVPRGVNASMPEPTAFDLFVAFIVGVAFGGTGMWLGIWFFAVKPAARAALKAVSKEELNA